MKESRLFQIVYCLTEKGHVTACELAKQLEVSVRTIYRDIDSLSAAGIPIYAEAGRNGGIYLTDHFVLDKALLSQNEKQEILASLQSLSAATAIDTDATLQKLAAVFQVDTTQWLEINFARWGNHENDNIKFQRFKTAIMQQRAVVITYAGTNGCVNKRCIYPLCLSYRSKAWYVKAYCTKHQAYRLFKLNRILTVEISEEHFSGYAYPQETETKKQAFPQVILRFSKQAAYRVYDEFDQTDIAIQPNGDLIVTAELAQDSWLIGYLLSFTTDVDVIAPADLKKRLVEQAKFIYEKNKC